MGSPNGVTVVYYLCSSLGAHNYPPPLRRDRPDKFHRGMSYPACLRLPKTVSAETVTSKRSPGRPGGSGPAAVPSQKGSR